jgi:hypothetical protein
LCLLHCYEFCITVTSEKCSYIRQKNSVDYNSVC